MSWDEGCVWLRCRGYALCALLLTASAVMASETVTAPVTIAAAADLKFALDEVLRAYGATAAPTPRVSYGSSGNIYTQIRQGAPFDIFLSADEEFVLALAREGYTRDEGRLYASGRIVLYIPRGSPLSADATLDDLARALADGRVNRFAIANPSHAPYGRAAREVLVGRGLWTAIEPHLVLGENVAQAAQFARSGAAQGGLIALSLALAPAFATAGDYALIPAAMHAPLRQRMVLLARAPAAAAEFYAYLGSPAARAILERYGFVLPDD